MKFINYDYVLTEMLEEMISSITQMEKGIKAQELILNSINKNLESKEVKDFITYTQESLNRVKSQLAVLKHRKECLERVFTYIKQSHREDILSLILEGFGLANVEGKTLEEREKNKEEICESNIA